MLDIWKFPFQALVFGVSLSVCMHSASGIKVEVIPKSPKKGDSVTLKVSDISGSIRFATWYRGKSTDANDQILNYFPREEFKGPKYIEGSHGQADGSLLIDSVSEDLKGDYTVQIQTTDSLQQATVYLAVSGVIPIALSPLVPLLGMLLFSELNFL
ncbi:carcinoembryonic antigen-related cell adhesion molecule 16-like [Rana temporaria]|uniref:carcinoembryonic antigen-related cell adhesion molecule 16-like n=1 Tax=Rana temporaria TaxID=8407 RepID=UPI001AAC4F84|nr:carcinoembryonic antigen-related cell adhesion molecule 16-like [Rana temporaria]XP_040183378.1 carcinoembryonic antigen-related cell adhesion molecule 16-like [Rana temporaria]